VKLLSSEDKSQAVYGPLEEQLLALLKTDAYFQCVAIDIGAVQTLGHLTATRDQSDFLPSVDAVEKAFAEHELALEKMTLLCDSLKTSAEEWKSTAKALAKARQLEEKAQKAEELRIQKKDEAARKKKAKAEEALLRAKQAKAEKDLEVAQQNLDSGGDAGAGKKRRIASKLTQELQESDPHVLLDRFPRHQIVVVDELDSRPHHIRMLMSDVVVFLIVNSPLST